MPLDYDLIIVGGSAVARFAAARARQLRARVALVEPAAPPSPLFSSTQIFAPLGQQLALWQYAQSQFPSPVRSSLASSSSQPNPEPSSQQVLSWLHETTDLLASSELGRLSLPALATSGVDVIVGEGHFVKGNSRRQRHPLLQVNDRVLHSRAYLLAPASRPAIPPIEGLATTRYCTTETLAQPGWQLPDRLIILGGTPHSLELAQWFNRLGTQVILVVQTAQLLPRQDPEIMTLLQAHLEAEGIDILLQTTLSQVKQLGEKIWVQAGDQALEADTLLLELGRYPAIGSLHLEAVNVEHRVYGIPVTAKLQTTNPHIYACGEALGGYPLPHLAQQEAELALHNALFFPTAAIEYRQIPWAIFTTPTVAQVGLTEAEARQYYGSSVVVLRQPLPSHLKAKLQPEPGLGKLVLRPSGEILGAQMMATHTEEWMGILALAMQHRIKLQDLGRSTLIASTHAEVLAQLIDQWQHHRLKPWQRNLMETWFNWRR